MESQLIVVNLNARKSIKVTGKVHSEAKRGVDQYANEFLLLGVACYANEFLMGFFYKKSPAQSFALNLGSDGSNLMLHVNPRFDSGGDIRTIVCNSMQDREWGESQRDDRFPFQQGEEAMIWISFDAKNVTVKVSEDHEIKFPNRLGLERIEFLSVDGDFKVQSIKID